LETIQSFNKTQTKITEFLRRFKDLFISKNGDVLSFWLLLSPL
jgi:hypothetical protein